MKVNVRVKVNVKASMNVKIDTKVNVKDDSGSQGRSGGRPIGSDICMPMVISLVVNARCKRSVGGRGQGLRVRGAAHTEHVWPGWVGAQSDPQSREEHSVFIIKNSQEFSDRSASKG